MTGGALTSGGAVDMRADQDRRRLLGRDLRGMLRRHQPDVIPDALIDAAELCIYGLEVSRRRAEGLR